MKKIFAIAGLLALSITPTASFADHLEPKESEIRPGGDLAHTNLKGRDLSGANLKGADLDDASLRVANLKDADLKGAYLQNADLSGANLRGADLHNAGLFMVNLKGADLKGANLNGSRIYNLVHCPSRLPNGWFCENIGGSNEITKR